MKATTGDKTTPRVLVVDDEDAIRYVISTYLGRKGCEVHTAGSTEEALVMLPTLEPEVALVDIVMPGRSGIQLLRQLKRHRADPEVIMMTSHGSAETAIQAIRRGAFDYLTKPFGRLDEIWQVVTRALEKQRAGVARRRVVDGLAQPRQPMEPVAVGAVDGDGSADGSPTD